MVSSIRLVGSIVGSIGWFCDWLMWLVQLLGSCGSFCGMCMWLLGFIWLVQLAGSVVDSSGWFIWSVHVVDSNGSIGRFHCVLVRLVGLCGSSKWFNRLIGLLSLIGWFNWLV